mmetsp:Transcript_6716/g.12196  ORF Transcript_6716/g.12196 Transcript_6716/m.12196 type:complete len:200 (-) Transcript_6716:153-752(-)
MGQGGTRNPADDFASDYAWDTRPTLKDCSKFLSVQPSSEKINRLVREVARAYNVEACVLTLHSCGTFHFYASYGLEPSVKTPPRGAGSSFEFVFFCHHISRDLPIVIQDVTKHLVARDQPLATGEQKTRFYVGAPLIWEAGTYLGTLSIFDNSPRTFNMAECELLKEKAEEFVNFFKRTIGHKRQRSTGASNELAAAVN